MGIQTNASKPHYTIALTNLQFATQSNDGCYDLLSALFEKLQLATYEASDMMLDFVTFVNSVRYFAVITREKECEADALKAWKTSIIHDSTTARGWRRKNDVQKDVVGMIYLTMPAESRNNIVGVNDLNIGVIISPEYRRKRYATDALRLVLDHAFQEIRCHRVQAIIMNPFTQAKYASYRLFTSIGFRQEGIRRSSYFNPFEGEYQDIAYLAILDTEWLTTLRKSIPHSMTPWDEVLRRHEHERETIMKWEDRIEDSDETETLHQFAMAEGGSEEESNLSQATSRATSPDLHSDNASESSYVESFSSNPFSGAPSERSDSPVSLESVPSNPFSRAPSERPESPLSSVDSNWDLLDDDGLDFTEEDI